MHTWVISPKQEDAMKLVSAVLKYFGRKEGQSLTEFASELKSLTDMDRKELAELLSTELKETIEA